MNIDLSGKTALVTGSTAGIGNAIAKGLAATGANVVINGRSQAKVDAAARAMAKALPGGKVRGIAADVSTAEGCKALLAGLPDVDILRSTTPMHLRAEGLLRHSRRGLEPLLRGQRTVGLAIALT